jgi:hypothetical protein
MPAINPKRIKCRDCGAMVQTETTTAGLCVACTNKRIQFPTKCKGCPNVTSNGYGYCKRCLDREDWEWAA